MNYLAHAYLSFNDPEILTGNMIADEVKGRLALEKYPAGIRQGILRHRAIDSRTDTHPAVLRAKLLFRAYYGLYSGAVVDTIFDHFLANDPRCFSGEKALLAFSQTVYYVLEDHQQYFPEKFAAFFPYMKQGNWLYNYRTVAGMEKSLNGLVRKAVFMAPAAKAYEIFISSYYSLNQCYYDFIDDIISFVKNDPAT